MKNRKLCYHEIFDNGDEFEVSLCENGLYNYWYWYELELHYTILLKEYNIEKFFKKKKEWEENNKQKFIDYRILTDELFKNYKQCRGKVICKNEVPIGIMEVNGWEFDHECRKMFIVSAGQFYKNGKGNSYIIYVYDYLTGICVAEMSYGNHLTEEYIKKEIEKKFSKGKLKYSMYGDTIEYEIGIYVEINEGV